MARRRTTDELPRREIPVHTTEHDRRYFREHNIRLCGYCNLPEGSWLHRERPADEFSGRWWDRDGHTFVVGEGSMARDKKDTDD